MREEMRDYQKEAISKERLVGQLISGFGTKAIVAGMALMLAHEVYQKISTALAPVATALGAQ
jgi:hypothetical protein